jgi:hypothetical protein
MLRFRQAIIVVAIVFAVLEQIQDYFFSKELKRRKTEIADLKTQLYNLDKEMVVLKKYFGADGARTPAG